MDKLHQYHLKIQWVGNKGAGTSNYRAYDRNHIISAGDKEQILASSDPSFRGDKSRYNPEELFVASLSSCHMLWYLHICTEAGVVVTDYVDNAVGTMAETDKGGHFKEVILAPIVTVADSSMIAKANELHHKANKFCFLANSVNFPVIHQPICIVKGG